MTDVLHALQTLAFPVDDAPGALRAVVGLLALLLVGFGARLGRHGPRVAVVLAGALGAVAAIDAADTPDRYYQPWAFVGLVSIGAAVALWLEKLGFRAALFVSGLVTGALWAVAMREAFGDLGTASFPVLGAASWATVGALTLAIGLPWVFETMPRVLAPLVGAAAFAWALGWPTSLPLLVGAWGLGVTAQMFTGPATLDLEGEEREEAR